MAAADPEFPPFPSDYEGLTIKPEKITCENEQWTGELVIENRGAHDILFKVKTTNNARCEITDCANIVPPKKAVTVPLRGLTAPKSGDRLLVVYTQYAASPNVVVNAFLAWQRAKSRDIIAKTIIVPIEKK